MWGNNYSHGSGDIYIDNAKYESTKAATIFMRNNNYKQLDLALNDNISLSGNISLEPLLSTSFHLRNSSPCIDSGHPEAPWLPTLDFENELRIMDGNSIPDIGADEHYPSSFLPFLMLLL